MGLRWLGFLAVFKSVFLEADVEGKVSGIAFALKLLLLVPLVVLCFVLRVCIFGPC